MDLDLLEAAITPRTRAIIPVDLAGLPVDRDRLAALAARHHLRIVEDAAQSFGSTWKGRRIGSFGDFVSFSFHANKNITTTEGGCLVLNDEREARLAEQYRLQGVVKSGRDGMEVELVGGKYNMTDVAARVGLGQLPHLEAFTAKRRELAKAYFDAFGGRGRGPRPRPPRRQLHRQQLAHVPGRAARGAPGRPPRGGHGGAGRRPASARGCTIPPSTSSPCTAGWAGRTATSRTRKLAGRNILTLPSSRRWGCGRRRRVVRELTAVLARHLKP
jgi:hypothetical protein